MKKLIYAIVCFFLLSSVGIAFEGATSSGEKTADAIIKGGTCWLASVIIITDGTNDAKLILYDNNSAALGTVLLEMTVKGTDHYGGRNYMWPVLAKKGVYADVNGTGASYIVEYIKR